MDVINLPLEKIKPYEKNPRNNKEAVRYVMESIREFGFKVPIVIDKNNVIVAGHTRYEASKRLKLKEVPCLIADDLSDEQVKAFRLADNKVAEKAEWDFDLLNEEINDLLELDMSVFGFDIKTEFELEQEHQEHKQKTIERHFNRFNLEIAQFEGIGAYDMPMLIPVKNLPDVKQWIGFNYMLSDKEPEGKGIHFYMDDYQFERIWNDPEKYIPQLMEYSAVITPDFSPYGDMPEVLRIFQHYRKQWVGAWLQSQGITVIPNVRFVFERDFAWCLDGIPKNSVIAISTVAGFHDEESVKLFVDIYNRCVYDVLEPSQVLVYGKMMEGMKGNIVNVPSFIQERWGD